MKSFVIDVAHCSGCYCCQLACKDEHCGNDWTPYAKPQPLIGQFWGKLIEHERGTVPKVKMAYVFMPCQHCENAPCIDVCPVDGAIYAREDGLVIIDPDKCSGCRLCIDACPYEVIYYNDNIQIAQKCTGCAHLVDRPNWIAGIRCADACPNTAIEFGDSIDTSGTETLYPEFGLTTRVKYKKLPKKFIAGCVYDSSKKEIVEGATCTLSGKASGNATTDEFGDFWFEDLADGEYSLKIEATGYATKTIDDINTVKDVNLGDIDLA
ncbi:MAG: carboxypeptidase regulatory-like domain-containing protein [Limnochordia bacterium]|nr:carboxypeptidase regulatory-like domain-containing protein [Limnochordia bacterium]